MAHIFDHTVFLSEKRDRVRARLNSAGTTTIPRSRINLIEGTGIDITVSDDAQNDELDITIAASGGEDQDSPEIIRAWDYAGSPTSDFPTTGFSLGKVPLGTVTAAGTGSSGMVNGQIRVWPFIVGRTGDIDTIQFDVIGTSGTTARARVAIYENASRTRLYPTTRVVESGEIDVSGSAGLKTASVSATLTRGSLYWAAYHTNSSTPVIRTCAVASQFSFCDTDASSAGAKLQIFNCFTFDKAYAAFPTTFYASGTGTGGASAVAASLIVPFIAIHYAT
jgi:hypothetical protein